MKEAEGKVDRIGVPPELTDPLRRDMAYDKGQRPDSALGLAQELGGNNEEEITKTK